MKTTVRARPSWLRALGGAEPPRHIEINGDGYSRIEIFKHDSWAATARYEGPFGDVVCKFNRSEPIMGVPMAWLGRRLAAREAWALNRLADLPGVPVPCGSVFVEGCAWENAVAHEYIAGRPLTSHDHPSDEFFPRLHGLLAAIHRRGIAYVDLHKRENIVVGEDGRPYLVDFQVHFHREYLWPRNRTVSRSILRALQQSDLYHLAKHVRRNRPDQASHPHFAHERPAWLDFHRRIAAPLRTLRRALLVLLGVRAPGGKALTESFPEDAIRHELQTAAAAGSVL